MPGARAFCRAHAARRRATTPPWAVLAAAAGPLAAGTRTPRRYRPRRSNHRTRAAYGTDSILRGPRWGGQATGALVARESWLLHAGLPAHLVASVSTFRLEFAGELVDLLHVLGPVDVLVLLLSSGHQPQGDALRWPALLLALLRRRRRGLGGSARHGGRAELLNGHGPRRAVGCLQARGRDQVDLQEWWQAVKGRAAAGSAGVALSSAPRTRPARRTASTTHAPSSAQYAAPLSCVCRVAAPSAVPQDTTWDPRSLAGPPLPDGPPKWTQWRVLDGERGALR
jgi:hypothetical protein